MKYAVSKQFNVTTLILIFICLAGYYINYRAFKPGFISPDGFDHYQQALTGIYNDWHPPAFSVLWHFLLYIHNGANLMLLFQLGLLWLGVFYLSINFQNNRLWYCLVFLFPVLPFVQNFAGYIIKDVHLALGWFCAVCILFHALVQKRKLHWVEALFSFFLIAYGTWVRINALPGVFTLCFLWCYVVFTKASGRKQYLYTAAFVVLILLGQKAISMYADPLKFHPENKLFQHDITGIYVRTGESFYPQELFTNPDYDTAYIRQHYHPSTYDMIWWNNDGKKIYVVPDEATITALRNAWLRAIRKHPGAYLAHRWEGFQYYMRIKSRAVPSVYADFVMENDFGIEGKPSRIRDVILYLPRHWQTAFYLTPMFWLACNLLLLAFIRTIKTESVKLVFKVLVFSSILFQAPSFFIFQVDDAFRYFYWNCIACTLSMLLLAADIIIRRVSAGSGQRFSSSPEQF